MTYEDFIQRYQYSLKTDRLGEGGFGEVFKAFDTHLDRYVALKIAKVKEDQPMFRLKKEVDIAAKLPTHANIARYEACYTFETPTGTFDFAILQYYEEGNLLKLIREKLLSEKQKHDLILQIIRGIQFLHDNNIIHRDLKPQNILIARRGEAFIPKISDFGISKQVGPEAESWVSNSLVGGSIAYASPEQLRGAKLIQKNTDLWSMGVLIYQIITGELPFNTGLYDSGSEQGRMEMARQITEGVLPEKIDDISSPFRQMIRRCMVVDPAQRIKSADRLFEILDQKDELVDINDLNKSDEATKLFSENKDLMEPIQKASINQIKAENWNFQKLLNKIGSSRVFCIYKNKPIWVRSLIFFLTVVILFFSSLLLRYTIFFNGPEFLTIFHKKIANTLGTRASLQEKFGFYKDAITPI